MRWPQSCETASQQVRLPHYFEAASQLVPVSQSHNWWRDLTTLKQPNNRWGSLTTVMQPLNWCGNLGRWETASKHVMLLYIWDSLTFASQSYKWEVALQVWSHVATCEAASWLVRQPHKWFGNLTTNEGNSQLWTSLRVSHTRGSLTSVM